MNASSIKLSALFLSALTACVSARESWHADGRILLADGREVRTRLTGVHAGAATDFGVFVAGYSIDAEGINHPYIALVDARSGDVRYWLQNYPVRQFFYFRDQWLAAAADGQVLRFVPAQAGTIPQWSTAAVRLGPDARVLQNGTGDTIACHPAAAEKSQRHSGGCQSLNRGWQLHADWLEPAPVLCPRHLLLLTGLGETRQLIVVRTMDGTVSHQATWSQTAAPHCADAHDADVSG